MANDVEAPFREGLIARSSSLDHAAEPFVGSSRRSGRWSLRLLGRLVPSMLLILVVVAASWWSGSLVESVGQSRHKAAIVNPADGTPVATVSDPLDSLPEGEVTEPDPLDGVSDELANADDGAPDDLEELEIVRSGRSRSSPDSNVAYDANRSTAWPAGELDNRWVWFDLGDPVRVRELRWLASGSGKLTIEVSDDREKWLEVGIATLDDTWSGLKLREDAQYVRLTFSENASDDASLIEFAAYGVPPSEGAGGGRSDELAQERKQRASDRKERRDQSERRAQRATNDEPAAADDGNNEANESGVTISTKPGKTKCKGDKARCRANKGTTRVEEDCASEGTCIIDVRADGGTAICEASAGDENETGQGEGKRPGRGGRCEATANGGTVTIGDINP